MHITAIAIGSRGDVQPRVATHDQFFPLLEGRGIEPALIQGNPRDILHNDRALSMLGAQGNAHRFLRDFTELLAPGATQMVSDSLTACEGTDAIILSNAGLVPGFHGIAEALGLPCCVGLLQPFLPTRNFASPFLPELPQWLGRTRGPYNMISHRLFFVMFHRFFAGMTRTVRRDMGLPPFSRDEMRRDLAATGEPILCGFSPSVVPRPDDWPTHVHVRGYRFLERASTWEPPLELAGFLAAGPPPVYVGFGSMTERDAAATTTLVVEALTRSRQRGIMLTGSGALLADDLPETVLAIESAPHDWLLPQMAAAVHHGGAGTTAASLRAGVPSILVPFFADQPFWGRTVHSLGVGPQPIPRRRLTAARLAHAIEQAVTDTQMRSRAAALGERIRSEDGVTCAVNTMLAHFQRHTG